MVKVAFILFCIVQGSSGEDVFQTKAFRDLGECEFQRQSMEHRGYVTGDRCLRINYKVN